MVWIFKLPPNSLRVEDLVGPNKEVVGSPFEFLNEMRGDGAEMEEMEEVAVCL